MYVSSYELIDPPSRPLSYLQLCLSSVKPVAQVFVNALVLDVWEQEREGERQLQGGLYPSDKGRPRQPHRSLSLPCDNPGNCHWPLASLVREEGSGAGSQACPTLNSQDS